MEEKRQQHAKYDKMWTDVLENDTTRCFNRKTNDTIDLSADKSIKVEEEVKVIAKSSRILAFYNRKKTFLPHRRPLNKRMKDRMVYYFDLLQSGPPLSRTNDKQKPQTSKKLVQLQWS